MTQLSPENLDKAFALLVEAAVKGERCPITSGAAKHAWLRSAQVLRLAGDKRILIQVGLGNWRQVTILHREKHATGAAAPGFARLSRAPLRNLHDCNRARAV